MSIKINGYNGVQTDIVFPTAIDGERVTYLQSLSRKNFTKLSGDSILSIGWECFSNCGNLSEVEFKECINVGAYAFSPCGNLRKVSFPKLSDTGYGAFSRDTNLTDVHMPECTQVGGYAFLGCTNLSNIYLPKCKYIAYEGFESCALQNVSFPECKNIGDFAFNSCQSLTEVSLPECSYLGRGVFRNCQSLYKVTLPECSSISLATFMNCSSLTEVSLPKCKTLNGYFNGYSSGVFENCVNLKEISLPECEFIGSKTFYNCTNLSVISLPKVNMIQNNAFDNTLWLSNQIAVSKCAIFENSSAKWIIKYDNTDQSFTRLEDSKITGVYGYAFHNMPVLSYVSLTGSPCINSCAFYSCSALTEIHIPDGQISSWGISDCVNLLKVTLPIKSFGWEGTVKHCTKLIEGNFPHCSYIGSYEFSNMTTLQTLTFPECTYVGASAFLGCTNLSSVYLPKCSLIDYDSNYYQLYGNAFGNCTSLSYIDLPSCEKLGCGAFTGCTSLKSVSLPECTWLGWLAFSGCTNLSEINLPKCSYILNGAVRADIKAPFKDCTALHTLYLGSSRVVRMSDTAYSLFINCPNLQSIYVPNNLINTYKTSTGWSSLASYFVPMDSIISYISLSMSAQDCFGKDTNTLLTATVTALYKRVGSSTTFESAFTVKDLSNDFPQNTSLTESIQRSVEYSYGPLTASTIINQGPYTSWYYNNKRTWADANAEGWWNDQYGRITLSGEINPSSIYNIPYQIEGTVINTVIDNFQSLPLVSIGGLGVTHIQGETFYNCSQLTTISFPNCSYISSPPFTGTMLSNFDGLNSLYFKQNQGCLFSSTSSKIIEFAPCSPFSAVSFSSAIVGAYAFESCSNITSISIASCTRIQEGGCCECENLSTFYASACSRVYGDAFTNCINLNTVYLLNSSSVINFGYDVFDGCSSLQSIYVTREYVDVYKNTSSLEDVKDKIVPFEAITNCKSLTITGDNCPGRNTSTILHINAICDLQTAFGEIIQDQQINFDDVSEEFPQNTSRTETVQRTLSYTYYNKTASCTITQDVWKDKDYIIENVGNYGFVVDSSIPNPDASLYAGVYRSNNQGRDDSAAVAKITFTGYSSFTVYIRSYAESYYDYTMASTLDADSYPTNYRDTTVKSHTRGNQQSGTALGNYTKVTYENDGNEHYIYIVFTKDSSSASGDDSGYFLIQK